MQLAKESAREPLIIVIVFQPHPSSDLTRQWAEAMADQGSGGAFEISQRMTAMVGWGATARFQEDWVFDQAAETYALDPDMAAKLRKNNPQVCRKHGVVILPSATRTQSPSAAWTG